ncbi:MAG: AbrB/MazE/SpoVT family DNA-binding domain-containing protein [Armatimonadota bacterium]
MPDEPPGLEELFVGSVTVGERGQVVIPARAREKMALVPGDKLLAFIHPGGQMVSLCKVSMLEHLSRSLSRMRAAADAEADSDDADQP